MGIINRLREEILTIRNYAGKSTKCGPPRAMCVETTNYCNLHCIMCNRDLMTRKLGHMEFSCFKKIVDESATFLDRMELQMWGEPLMNPEIFKFIDYSKSKNVKVVRLSTNGILLGKENSRRIIDSKVDVLTISLNAYTKQTYEKITQSPNFELVVSNIENYFELRGHGKRPYTILQFIPMKVNINEIEMFREKWREKADFIYIRRLSSLGDLRDIYRKQRIETIKRSTSPCASPWQQMYMYVDGTVVFCGNDVNAAIPIGNVTQNTIRDIWVNNIMSTLRDSLRGDQPPFFCKDCAEWSLCKLPELSQLIKHTIYSEIPTPVKEVYRRVRGIDKRTA